MRGCKHSLYTVIEALWGLQGARFGNWRALGKDAKTPVYYYSVLLDSKGTVKWVGFSSIEFVRCCIFQHLSTYNT